jgi:glycosyltransferase involved in cell wall biosynthesis
MYPGGRLESVLDGAGIQVINFNKTSRWSNATFIARLVEIIHVTGIDVLYSFLPTPNIISAIVGILVPELRVAWGIRAAGLGMENPSKIHVFAHKLESLLSRQPDVIISNSDAGLRSALLRGFPKNKLSVIHNGIDTSAFYPDRNLGKSLRTQWRVNPEDTLIGIVARLDPIKNHELFLQAAAQAARSLHKLRFVVLGSGDSRYSQHLHKIAEGLDLNDRVIWVGDQTDMLSAYNALDILSLCSRAEGFPNAVSEAMACGVPCVSTNVGDCKSIIGEFGRVLSDATPEDLVNSWEELISTLQSSTTSIGRLARERIIAEYSIERMALRTLECLSAIL